MKSEKWGGTVQGVSNQTTRWVINGLWFYSWQRYEIFLFSTNIQTSSEAQPASYPMGYPEYSWSAPVWAWSLPLTPSHAKIISKWTYICTISYLHDMCKDNFTLLIKIRLEEKRVRNYRSTKSSVSYGFCWSNNTDSFHFLFFQNNGWFKITYKATKYVTMKWKHLWVWQTILSDTSHRTS